MKALHLKLYGRVQGIGFRYFAEEIAEQMQLKGWARNNSDKSFECLLQGEEEKVEKAGEAVKKGPVRAKIEKVEEEWIEAEEFKEFKIL